MSPLKVGEEPLAAQEMMLRPIVSGPAKFAARATLWTCLLYAFANGSASHRETTMSNYAHSRSFGGAEQLVGTKHNYRATTIVNESLCPGNSWQAAMASRQA